MGIVKYTATGFGLMVGCVVVVGFICWLSTFVDRKLRRTNWYTAVTDFIDDWYDAALFIGLLAFLAAGSYAIGYSYYNPDPTHPSPLERTNENGATE